MELDHKLGYNKLEAEDPSLSGAYIRSLGLVKQITTTTSKDTTTTTMKTKVDPGCVFDSNVSSTYCLRKQGKVLGTRHQAQQHNIQQQQQHKKQVRRRLHTSRPYQERLLNMAEARKEIVTALKFHRAAMKQATEQKQQQQQAQQQQEEQQQQQQPSVSHHPSFEQDGRFKSRRNPRIYPSCTTSFSNYMNENDFSCSSFSIPNYYTWPVVSPIAPPPAVAENPNLTLPNQTLGLNLNLHDFNNLDATLFLNNHNNNNNSSFCTYSSPRYSSSPPVSVVTDQEIPTIGISQGEGVSSLVDTTIESSSAATQVSGGLHATMDDEGMAEMRSLGEQYQMEWNDTMNLITSARWSKFLKNMEHGAAAHEVRNEDDANHCMFDELIEFPAWLNGNDNCLEQCFEDYFKDPSLPCMDIGDIEFEAKDEEWLA